jgi:hypothetical protein
MFPVHRNKIILTQRTKRTIHVDGGQAQGIANEMDILIRRCRQDAWPTRRTGFQPLIWALGPGRLLNPEIS